MATVSLSASDGLVITMLVMMTASLGVLAVLAICMCRNVARRNREVDKLLEEVAAEEEREKLTQTVGDAPAQDPWEKDGDWWKQ